MVWVFLAALDFFGNTYYDSYGNAVHMLDADGVNEQFLSVIPWVVGVIGVWFTIAYFSNVSMVRHATGARPLERRENPRVYNIVENLTIAGGMDMPKINIIDDVIVLTYLACKDKDKMVETVEKLKQLNNLTSNILRSKISAPIAAAIKSAPISFGLAYFSLRPVLIPAWMKRALLLKYFVKALESE